MIYWPPKAPGEVEDFEFDFTDLLQAGETISSRTVTATGVTRNSDSVSGGIVTVWLSGGTLGTPGIVTCAVTTNAGRTYSVTGIVPIGEEPVSLTMARKQTRTEGTTADDDHVLGLIQTAREYAENYCGIRLVAAALGLTFPSFAAMDRLTAAPIQSVVGIQYLDASGALQTLDAAVYETVNVDADLLRPRIRLAYSKSWPAIRSVEDAVRVSVVAGYAVVPMPIIRAMLLLIGHWYDNRLPVAVDVRGQPLEIPHGVTPLLTNFRR